MPAALRRAVLLGATLIALAGCGGMSRVSSDDLMASAQDARSLAAEGAILADAIARGRTTSAYATAHTDELTEQAHRNVDDLAAADAPPELTTRLNGERQITADIGHQLDKLHSSPDDRSAAAVVAAALRSDADAARQAGGGT